MTPLSQLRPGMALASDAESPDGRYRLPAGLELSEGHLRLLRSWRLREADVEPVAPPPPVVPETTRSPQEAIEASFAPLPADEPLVAALRGLALARAEQLAVSRPSRKPPPPHHRRRGDPHPGADPGQRSGPRLAARSVHAHP